MDLEGNVDMVDTLDNMEMVNNVNMVDSIDMVKMQKTFCYWMSQIGPIGLN